MVEDDPSIRAALGLALEDEGYEVLQSPNGRTGLAMLAEESPDIVLLDLRLPDISGFDVCREMRQRSSVPIIIVTAQTDTHDLVAGLEAGARVEAAEFEQVLYGAIEAAHLGGDDGEGSAIAI